MQPSNRIVYARNPNLSPSKNPKTKSTAPLTAQVGRLDVVIEWPVIQWMHTHTHPYTDAHTRVCNHMSTLLLWVVIFVGVSASLGPCPAGT